MKLILREALAPLVAERVATFDAAVERAKDERDLSRRISILTEHDPAEALLRLKVCDPAMGSGHFLVSLVDDLADRVLEQIADAQAKARSIGVTQYQSRLATDLAALRERILSRASAGHWAIDPALLDDRHLVRRMLLKRVVHGADKNPMAVELAKLALWLHTFTVGAPLSFLDHHLRCGDALFGERLATVRRDLNKLGGLFNDSQVAGLLSAARTFAEISGINDVDLEEVERSRELMEQADGTLDGLKRVFDLWQALRWVAPLDVPKRLRGWKQDAVAELLSGRYRLTLMELLRGEGRVQSDDPAVDERVNALLDECRALARAEGFLHWELAFPSAWPGLPDRPEGGFDAIVGNPPWDRMKLQEVEWFADRKPEIALQGRAADRKTMVAALRTSADALAADYDRAAQRAEDAARVARSCGEYPLLSGGDVNLYSLFVERAEALVAPTGVVGLLVPSGIAGDKGASAFFRSISTSARLGTLIDLENRKVFFPDVHASFKFSALVFGGKNRRFETTRCAFYVQRIDELEDPDRLVQLDPDAFAAINPNTGTAPIFRSARDAELTAAIYATNPVLVRHRFETRRNRDGEEGIVKVGEDRAYPVRYMRMFDMTMDSALFHTERALTDAGGYKVAPNRWKSPDGDFVPLYEGKMVQAYDHRAASVVVNPDNLHRPAQPVPSTDDEKAAPDWSPTPQYWISLAEVREKHAGSWSLGFKEITAPTNARTMIAALMPTAGFGNKVPVLLPVEPYEEAARHAAYILATFNSMCFDYVLR